MVSEIFQTVADFIVREGDRLPELSGNAQITIKPNSGVLSTIMQSRKH